MNKMRILFSLLTLLTFQANAAIVVDFTFTTVCEGSQTTLTSTSVASGGATITNWDWDLDGDGLFDDASGPSIAFQFNAAGNHNVGLLVTTDMDAPVSVYNAFVMVLPVPVADFIAPDVCEGTVSALADASTIATGSSNVMWEWDLDNDGLYDNAVGSLIAHDFVTPSSYVVGLQVTSDQGCQSTTAENVTVDPMPTVEFSVAEVCLGDQTELTAITTVSSGSVTDYNWELNGNGLFDDATGQMITNEFSADGDYQIGLQVVSDQGCTIDTFQLMTIAPYPFVGFTFDNACQNNAVQFYNSTQNMVGSITYDWTFGLEGTSSDEHPSFSFTSAGPAQITLIGLTSFGCPDTVVQTLEVYPSPEADFTATEVCFGQTTAFTNTTDPKGSTIANYDWFFGDNNQGFGTNPTHEYFDADSFLVTMVAHTTDGCRDTVEHYVHVWALPTPVITASGPVFFCAGDSVTLTVNPNGTPNLWSTGETTQSITVDTTGQYEVLIVDDHGCQGGNQMLVYRWELPELSISNDTSVSLGEMVPLWVEGANNSYEWSPGTYLDDPSIDMPTSSPKESIDYVVTGEDLHIIGTDEYFCYSTAEVSIEVLIDYNLKPVNLFTPNLDGKNERFYIGNIECYSDCVVKVYNRWGLEVYTSSAYQNDWTGEFNDDPLPDGTYYYTIECDGKDGRFDGAVTILRNNN